MSIKKQTIRYGLFLLPTLLLAQTGTGLKGDYFSNTALAGTVSLSRLDTSVNFDWGPNAPAAAIPADNFSARWSGQVEAPATGTYTFATQADDGVRLWVDGKLLINRWTNRTSARDQSVPVSLTGGRKYDIQLEYYDNSGNALVKLLWSYPGQAEQLIPQGRLYVAAITPQVAPVVTSSTWVSAMPFLSETNGWGPLERDRSNGDKGATDGVTLKVDGHAYARGLGVHAASEVKVALDGRFDVFKAIVGVDDAVGNSGTVVFEVWIDGAMKFQSPVMRGNMPGLAVEVPTKNGRELKLIVTNADGSISYDHADWADARLEIVSAVTYLSDLNWVSAVNGRGQVLKDHPIPGATGAAVPERFMLRGKAYTKGLGTFPQAEVKYDLAKKYERFNAVVGVDDTAVGRGSVIFEVWSGTVMLFRSDVLRGTSPARAISIDVTDKTELILKVSNAGDGSTMDIADWADAQLVPIAVSAPPPPTPNPVALPGAPGNLTASAGNALVNLTWQAVSGATSYNVYRGTSTNAQSSTPIATNLTGTTYSNTALTNGTTYFYKVRAVNTAGAGNPSNEASAKPAAPPPNITIPGAPASLTATAGNALVNLAWPAVSGATSYSVYRGTATNAQSSTPIATNLTGTTYSNTGLTNGTTYFYKVRAVNSAGAGNPSAEASARPSGPAPTAAPANLTATAGNQQIALTWAAVTGATGYNVYRGTATNAQATTAVATNVTATNYTNTGLTNGTRYFYKVAATNTGGVGPSSAEASAIPLGAPTAPILMPPTTGDGRVTLSWTAVNGATTYNLYRGTAANGQGNTPIATNITGLTYANTGLTNGTGYFYRLTAVNAAGESPRSNEVTGTPSAAAPPSDATTLSAFRLLRQASWGPKPGDIDRVRNMGRGAYLDEQFGAAASAYPDSLYGTSVEEVQEHLLRLAITGNDQLRQRVAFALSKIWAVNASEVNRADATVVYYRTFMNRAFGNYRDLMTDMSLNPAMGRFLNMLNSKSEAVTTVPANENYPRELLQLFTLGTSVLSNDGSPQAGSTYTEEDVKALARLFTGWTYGDGNAATIPTNSANANWVAPMEAVERFHDVTAKTFLGTSFAPNRTTRQDLDQALDVIFNHPTLPPYVAKSLISQLVTSNPSPAYVAAVTNAFINNGNNVRGDLRATVRAILEHPEANLGTNTAGKLMEPVLLVISPLRTLNASVSDFPFMATHASDMGQRVLYPPSVFSYFSPFFRIRNGALLGPEFQLLTTVTALTRTNYMARVLNGDLGGAATVDYTAYTSRAADAAALTDYVALQFMGGQLSTEQRSAIITAVNATPASNPTERAKTALYLVLASAQYQVDR